MEFFIRESTVRAAIPQAQSGKKKKFNIKTVSATGLPDVATETSKYSCRISSTTHEEVYDGIFSVKKINKRPPAPVLLVHKNRETVLLLMSKIGSSDGLDLPRVSTHF